MKCKVSKAYVNFQGPEGIYDPAGETRLKYQDISNKNGEQIFRIK